LTSFFMIVEALWASILDHVGIIFWYFLPHRFCRGFFIGFWICF
jgi:hypothetical protein